MSENLSKPGLSKLLSLIKDKKSAYPILYHIQGSIYLNDIRKYNGGTIFVSNFEENTSIYIQDIPGNLQLNVIIVKVENKYKGDTNKDRAVTIYINGQKHLLDGHGGSYANLFICNGLAYIDTHNIYDDVGNILYQCNAGKGRPIIKGGKELLDDINIDHIFTDKYYYEFQSVKQGGGRDGNEKQFIVLPAGLLPPPTGYLDGDKNKMEWIKHFRVSEGNSDIIAAYIHPTYLVFSKDSYFNAYSEDLIVYKTDSIYGNMEGRIILNNVQELAGRYVYYVCEMALSIDFSIDYYNPYRGSYLVELV